MKVFTVPATCSICGGPGRGMIRDMAAIWTEGVVHKDPSVCRYYINKQKIEEQEKAELENSKKPPENPS